jgi:hypothetical protein
MKKILYIIFLLIFLQGTALAWEACDSTHTTRASLNSAITAADGSARLVLCVADSGSPYTDFSDQDNPVNVTNAAATSGKEIVIQAETEGGVQFNGTIYFYITQDYYEFKGFKFYSNQSHTPATLTAKIFSFWGASATNSKITNNYWLDWGDGQIAEDSAAILFRNGAGDGVEVAYNTVNNLHSKWLLGQCGSNCSDIHIHHNHIVNCGNHDRSVWEIGDGANVITHEYNWYENCKPYDQTPGADNSTIISDKSDSTIHRFNVFSGSNYVTLRGGDGDRVEGNYWLNCGSNSVGGEIGLRVFKDNHVIINNYFESCTIGILLGSRDFNAVHYEAADNAKVYNNTFKHTDSGGGGAIYIGPTWNFTCPCLGPDSPDLKNNIIENDEQYAVQCFNYETTITTADNIVTNSGYWNLASSSTCNSICGSSPAGFAASDPDLIQGTDIWRLQASSTNAIEQGTVIAGVTVDIDGEARDGSTPDIGADEYNSTTVSAMIAKSCVGATWLPNYVCGGTISGVSISKLVR